MDGRANSRPVVGVCAEPDWEEVEGNESRDMVGSHVSGGLPVSSAGTIGIDVALSAGAMGMDVAPDMRASWSRTNELGLVGNG